VLRIPEEHVKGLTSLALLPDEVAVALHRALSEAAEKKDGGSVSDEDLGQIPGISRKELEAIVEAILSLNQAKAYYEMSVDDFLDAISNSLESASKEFPHATDGDTRIRERIKEFIGIPSIARLAKATILRYDHERTFHGAKILTDLRPVFGSNVDDAPEALVLTHTLKVGYHRSGQKLQEAFFVMDEGDLEDLKKAVARAESKAKSIRSALAKTSLRVLQEE
jgi:hypothetical protein